RFLGRVYRFVVRNAKPDHPDWRKPLPADLPPAARAVQRKLHQTIKRVSDDFQGRWHFNTCISAIMELVNALYAYEESAVRAGAGRRQGEGCDRRQADRQEDLRFRQAGQYCGEVMPACSRCRVILSGVLCREGSVQSTETA